jgi:hypothetical protein
MCVKKKVTVSVGGWLAMGMLSICNAARGPAVPGWVWGPGLSPRFVDLRGVEPLTSCLPSKRSTN